MNGQNPKVRDILILFGITGFVSASLVMPGLPIVLKPFIKKSYKKWGHFNQRRLKWQLKRLQKSGVIEKIDKNGEAVLRLTDKGKIKLFKINLDNIDITKLNWDYKWRLVVYDIPEYQKIEAGLFRQALKKMQFVQVQKSIWLTPYPCEKEIEFLKAFYNLKNVTILTVKEIEGDRAYKNYFGL